MNILQNVKSYLFWANLGQRVVHVQNSTVKIGTSAHFDMEKKQKLMPLLDVVIPDQVGDVIWAKFVATYQWPTWCR